ncbi:hypothetical protein AB4K20DRAFT_1986147 [Rhizopus microsporus]
MGNVQYQPPNAIPDAAHRMKPPQTKQDMALKRLQYLISGIFCPLNIFGHEISLDNENANIQRYLTILADCHTLLLNLSSQVNNMRNTMAFQTINPTFKSTAAPTKMYSPVTIWLQNLLYVSSRRRCISRLRRISVVQKPCQ